MISTSEEGKFRISLFHDEKIVGGKKQFPSPHSPFLFQQESFLSLPMSDSESGEEENQVVNSPPLSDSDSQEEEESVKKEVNVEEAPSSKKRKPKVKTEEEKKPLKLWKRTAGEPSSSFTYRGLPEDVDRAREVVKNRRLRRQTRERELIRSIARSDRIIKFGSLRRVQRSIQRHELSSRCVYSKRSTSRLRSGVETFLIKLLQYSYLRALECGRRSLMPKHIIHVAAQRWPQLLNHTRCNSKGQPLYA